MEPLQPVIRPYDWGSRHGIAELQGRPVPAPGPEAELWLGAHPSAPSGVAATTLDAVIAADPDRELGQDCVARFGPRLPFLLKVLSADRALSIQVHPSRAQAQAGFRAENDRGLAPADRNYVDDWPKPELLCALTPFEVLAGLRTPSDAAALLRALAVARRSPPLAAAADLAAARPHRPRGPQPRPGRHPHLAGPRGAGPRRGGRLPGTRPGLTPAPAPPAVALAPLPARTPPPAPRPSARPPITPPTWAWWPCC